MKLLIIEDERELSASIVAYLSSKNYVCEQAFTYAEALEKVGLYDYDCVLLDLMQPGGNGLDILREIRKRQNPVGVIIVSAKDSLELMNNWPKVLISVDDLFCFRGGGKSKRKSRNMGTSLRDFLLSIRRIFIPTDFPSALRHHLPLALASHSFPCRAIPCINHPCGNR